MKIYSLFLILCLAACGCALFKQDGRVKFIDKYSDELTTIIKRKDVTAYLNCIPKRDDIPIDYRTGNYCGLPFSEERTEEDFKHLSSIDFKKGFESTIQALESKLGDLSNVQCSEVKYRIQDDPIAKQYGILQFEFTLELVNGHKTAFVWQSCVLYKRGVLIADCMTLENDGWAPLK